MLEQDGKIRRSLRFSFLDGIFASCMVGLTADYITPYALALKATVGQIGLLNSIPNLIASLFQLKSPDVTERLSSRNKAISIFVFLHALMGIFIILIPYLFYKNRLNLLITFVTLFAAFNAAASGAWASLMSDHIPQDKRGQYFGWRNKILGFVTVICALLAGFILYRFAHNILKGFFIIFISAITCRFISWYFLTKMYEPPLIISKEHYFSFYDFIRRIKESNFAKFVIFVASLNFSVNLAAPFFAVFMLKDLKFNYLTYTIVVTTATLTSLLLINKWGILADRIGNIKVLRFTSLFIASLPFLWVISQNPIYLIFIQVLSGFAWSGFNLCSVNFIYDAVTPEKRTRCVSYFNVLNGLALCLGALLGGYLANHLPPLLGYRILSLFLVSSLMRYLAINLSHKLKEVRAVQKISSKDLFYTVIGIKKNV